MRSRLLQNVATTSLLTDVFYHDPIKVSIQFSAEIENISAIVVTCVEVDVFATGDRLRHLQLWSRYGKVVRSDVAATHIRDYAVRFSTREVGLYNGITDRCVATRIGELLK
jgi:hypothetical protein